jgi:hypothetical protein
MSNEQVPTKLAIAMSNECPSGRAMRIMLTVFMMLALGATAFGQEIKFSGEAKTGIYWQQSQQESTDAEVLTKLKSTDDAGSNQGRFQLNMDFENSNGFGFKARIRLEDWTKPDLQIWNYSFGYGNFFDNQLTISAGRLGASPWGSGGPELWKDLEEGTFGGMRVEWKPGFVPADIGVFNVGFVLNFYDSDRDQGWESEEPVTILNLLQESILGVSYTHDLFHARFAYRLDGSLDSIQSNKQYGGMGEDSMVYRIEERVLQNYLPGLQVLALGHLFGLSAKIDEIKWFRNWLYIKYAPEMFTAQVRLGYEYIESRSDLRIKPSFFWNFDIFGNKLEVGAAFEYCQDFGKKLYEGSPYHWIELQPKIQLNFSSSYVAFEYDFKREYVRKYEELAQDKEPIRQTQYMNLRFCIYF